MNIASPSGDDPAGIRARGHPWTPQISNYFIDISHVKPTNPSETHPHGQLRPGSLNRITGKKDHLQVGKMAEESLNDLIIQQRMGWRDVARKARPFVREQARITLHVEIGSGTQAAYALPKANIALVSTSGRICSLSLR